MSTSRFVHLHVHTEFSLADSTIRVPEKPDQADPKKAKQANLLSRAVELDMPALAVTDLNNLFALVKFYKAAEGVGIKPIAGADVMIATPDMTPWRMTLLCRDREGYLSLSRLLTRAWMEGHRPEGGVAIHPEWLQAGHANLFALAGRDSLAGRLFNEGRADLAEQQLADWQRVFGDGLHLELTRTGRDGEERFNQFALHAAGVRGLPVVASNDVRFLYASDFNAHEARVCISSGRVLDDPKRPREYSDQQYLKSSEEMAALFADIPDAIDNTHALAQRCNIEMRLGTYFLPAYPVPEDETLDSWIRSQSRDGLAARLEKSPLAPGKTRQDYVDRLEFELDTIIKMGFPGYFLIVADFIQWGKNQGIPIGPGRGSGAGSLVAWALQITDLDPLPYNLLFERFLNPERVSMPDFDIDFCMDRRDEVIDYVARKYGRERVSQIITYGTMAAKAVVRDAGRVLGFTYGLVDSVAKLIPNILGITLKDAMGEGKDSEMASPDLIQRYQVEDDVRDLMDLARQLEDLTRNAGKHAGGVVIAPEPLSEFCPLFAEHDEDGRGKNPVTQFDKDDVEAVGLVKFDFLGLRTLTIIDWAVKAINVRHARAGIDPVDITTIPLDDVPTYKGVFASGSTGAVFQFESSGMRRLLKDARPDRFEDLIALVSLYRPGPMDLIPDFNARKHGQQEIVYPDPRTEAILKDTYGIMVYQEQVMQMAQIVGDYSLGGADLLRRAMGKKVPAEMAKHREIFREGAAKGGVSAAKADEIFDLMEKFAGYGFNKSHAAAYALVSYQTAWLKRHYPAEFMAATLSSDMDNTDKVVGFLDEVRNLGLTVKPPRVNESAYMFEAATPDTIQYGLGAIKGVGQGACEAIVEERQRGGPYTTLLDFCTRVGTAKLNRRTLEAMINAGAMDGLGKNRASLMLQLPEVMKATEQMARERASGQNSLFGGPDPSAPAMRLDLPESKEWPLGQLLTGERETLGFYLSGHPFDPHREEVRELVGCDLGALEKILASQQRGGGGGGGDGEKRAWRPEVSAILAGQVIGVRRKGDSQVFVQLEDGRGRVECSAFSDAMAEFGHLLTRDRILIVKGGLREDEFNGGYSLRIRQCWDYEQICADHAQRLSLRLDLREKQAFKRIDALLAKHRPGKTPLRLDLLLRDQNGGVAGMLDLNGSHSVRIDQQLMDSLRADPAVRTLKIKYSPPWA
ncbi:DNA polymerase III subunit alpha [Xanthomonas nasturtii]|uniref:DNA polymerase III subunit alpha n=1 Tax=Xanthomonas nasturtii TaxID=1843581 RepID=A0ABT0LM36_9XANT|nr:DNA polymerase III subunit alpha [Xanthomonas nasturtii]MCL1499369.1 DNA polymerase III subunit alpha [Xanthomonas nasturtii]MCL1503654.1 DNA polymerase III subunit alpha [Xanthomonas nasturtii]MCL1522977.1 DNA polymerase III subunit alpha [Xanthomonas nasturtii]MCL1549974.1 DNA polymerase III subunit alpha [Xanthomonas nasturtii]MCL1553870.1 DNA polymerase III subunit alpha [Xanthomonas nasturtii]